MLGFIGSGVIVIVVFGFCVWAVFKLEEGLEKAAKPDDAALKRMVTRFVTSEVGKLVLACGLAIGVFLLLVQIGRMLGLR